MTCIQCEDALKKGLTKCPKCGEIFEEKTNELEENSEGKLNDDSVDGDSENTLDNIEEDLKEYEAYTKRLRLYTMICGLIGIAFLIFVFYIIFD